MAERKRQGRKRKGMFTQIVGNFGDIGGSIKKVGQAVEMSNQYIRDCFDGLKELGGEVSSGFEALEERLAQIEGTLSSGSAIDAEQLDFLKKIYSNVEYLPEKIQAEFYRIEGRLGERLDRINTRLDDLILASQKSAVSGEDLRKIIGEEIPKLLKAAMPTYTPETIIASVKDLLKEVYGPRGPNGGGSGAAPAPDCVTKADLEKAVKSIEDSMKGAYVSAADFGKFKADLPGIVEDAAKKVYDAGKKAEPAGDDFEDLGGCHTGEDKAPKPVEPNDGKAPAPAYLSKDDFDAFVKDSLPSIVGEAAKKAYEDAKAADAANQPAYVTKADFDAFAGGLPKLIEEAAQKVYDANKSAEPSEPKKPEDGENKDGEGSIDDVVDGNKDNEETKPSEPQASPEQAYLMAKRERRSGNFGNVINMLKSIEGKYRQDLLYAEMSTALCVLGRHAEAMSAAQLVMGTADALPEAVGVAKNNMGYCLEATGKPELGKKYDTLAPGDSRMVSIIYMPKIEKPSTPEAA